MQNLSIRQVLGLLFIVPVLCVSVSLWQLGPLTFGRMNSAKALEESILLAEVAGRFVHALQRERGASAGLVSTKTDDAAQREAVTKLRAASDADVRAFDDQVKQSAERLSGRLKAFSTKLDSLHAGLKTLRARVDKRDVVAAQVINGYSELIADIVDNVGQGGAANAGQTIADFRLAFGALMQAKELAGIERASGNALLGSTTVDPLISDRFIGMGAAQAMRLKEMRLALGNAPLAQKHLTPEMQAEHAKAQAAILLPIHTGQPSALAREDWWKISTRRIDAMHELERDLAAQLKSMAREDADASFRDFAFTLALQVISVLIGLGLTAWIGQLLSAPIRRAAQALERAAAGDTSVQAPPPMSGKGEIGLISNAVGAFIAANVERARLIAEREAAEASMSETRVRVLGQMETEFNAASRSATDVLQEAAHTLNARSAAMLSTVGAVRQAQDEAIAAAESSRGTVTEVTRLSEELGQSIAEIAQQSTRTAQLASEVQTRADASREAATQFEEVAQAIGSIVDLINAIAGQTNLLALNATIEAARAGDMGKGFAVVAGEVKELAARTMEATRTIEAKVGELKGIARTAAEQATALSDDVGNIQGLNSAIAAAVHQQHMTSEGFTGSIQSLAGAVNAVVEQVDAIARLGSDAHASASAVQDVADEMERTTTTLAETLPRLIADTSRRIAG